MPKDGGINLKGWHILIIVLAILVASGIVTFNFSYQGQTGQTGTGTGTGTGGGTGGTTGSGGGTVYDSAALKFALQNSITDGSISGGNEGMDISKVAGGVFDPLSKSETVADWSAATATSALTYVQGDTLVAHVYSDNDETGGTDTYDTWYYFKLEVGEKVRVLTTAQLSVVQSSPTYKYNLASTGAETGYVVSYDAGTTPYWNIGVVKVAPRSTAANMTLTLTYSGTTLVTFTDGSSFEDTQGEQNSDATLVGTSNYLKLQVVADTTNIMYGAVMYTVSVLGEFQRRPAYVIFSTNCTALGNAALIDEGWSVMNDATAYASKAYYKEVGPWVANKGDKFDVTINIKLDTTSAATATAFSAMLWLIDFQLPSAVAVGSTSTSIPTAYGMVAAYGIDAKIYASAYSTSSGVGTGEILFADFTTAS